MPAVYSSQPISGFTGHIPGSKWQVGSRYIAPVKYPASVIPVLESTSGPKEEVLEDKSFQNGETMQLIEEPNEAIERSIEKQQDASEQPIKEYHNSQKENGPQGVDFVQHKPQNRITEQGNLYPQGFEHHGSEFSLLHSGDSESSMEFRIQESPHSEEAWQARRGHQGEQSMKQRARSLPRKILEKNPFEGLTGGWWSKGEVLRNKERRELVNRGRTVTAGEFSQTIKSPKQKRWQNNAVNDNDIPAVGYSGHLPGLRQMGLGKSFNTAAREAKRNYVMKRRARSGEREQFEVTYGEENWSNTQPSGMQNSLSNKAYDNFMDDQVNSTGKSIPINNHEDY